MDPQSMSMDFIWIYSWCTHGSTSNCATRHSTYPLRNPHLPQLHCHIQIFIPDKIKLTPIPKTQQSMSQVSREATACVAQLDEWLDPWVHEYMDTKYGMHTCTVSASTYIHDLHRLPISMQMPSAHCSVCLLSHQKYGSSLLSSSWIQSAKGHGLWVAVSGAIEGPFEIQIRAFAQHRGFAASSLLVADVATVPKMRVAVSLRR